MSWNRLAHAHRAILILALSSASPLALAVSRPIKDGTPTYTFPTAEPYRDPSNPRNAYANPAQQSTLRRLEFERKLHEEKHPHATHMGMIRLGTSVMDSLLRSIELDLQAGKLPPLEGRLATALEKISALDPNRQTDIQFVSPKERPGIFNEEPGSTSPHRIAVTGDDPSSPILINSDFVERWANESKMPSQDQFLEVLGILTHETAHHAKLTHDPSDGLEELSSFVAAYARDRMEIQSAKDAQGNSIVRLFKLNLADETRLYYADGIYFKDLSLPIRRSLSRLALIPLPGNKPYPMSAPLKLGSVEIIRADGRGMLLGTQILSPAEVLPGTLPWKDSMTVVYLPHEKLADGKYALTGKRGQPELADARFEIGRADHAGRNEPVAISLRNGNIAQAGNTFFFEALIPKSALPGTSVANEQLQAVLTLSDFKGHGPFGSDQMFVPPSSLEDRGDMIRAVYGLPIRKDAAFKTLRILGVDILPANATQGDRGERHRSIENLNIQIQGGGSPTEYKALSRYVALNGKAMPLTPGDKTIRIRKKRGDLLEVGFDIGFFLPNEPLLSVLMLLRTTPKMKPGGGYTHTEYMMQDLTRSTGIERSPLAPGRIYIKYSQDEPLFWNGEELTDYTIEGFEIITERMEKRFVAAPLHVLTTDGNTAPAQGLEVLEGSGRLSDWEGSSK